MYAVWWLIGLLTLAGTVRRCRAAPVQAPHHVESTYDAQMYFYQYGYNAPGGGGPGHVGEMQNSPEKLREMIKDFQEIWSLNITGELDEETIALMNRRRCGNQDRESKGDLARRKRFALQGSKWMKSTLTYRILSYPKQHLTPSETVAALRRAFRVWEEVSPIQFKRITKGTPDIKILFEGGDHGDEYPFDGLGNTLAHAFFPEYGGATHFDGDEPWSNFTAEGTDLHHVATHEIGHALGLSHSNDRSALMAPFYRPYNPDLSLQDDDRRAIQFLYGIPQIPADSTVNPSTSTITDTPSNDFIPGLSPNSVCASGEVDAIALHFEQGEENTYAFRGDYYMLVLNDKVAPGYPRHIAIDWPGLPGHVDAALYWPNVYRYNLDQNNRPIERVLISPARTYFFRGGWFWHFQERVLLPGYPKLIRTAWPGVPDDLDAAFVWSGNGETFFVKDSNYYRYVRGVGVPDFYPKPLSIWNLPERIDAAFQWTNGKTYFFEKDLYYRFNDDAFQIDQDFPRLTAHVWFGCNESSSAARIVHGQSPDSSSFRRPRILLVVFTTLVVLCVQNVICI